MNVSQTSGLSSYQQTVHLTPGLASSIWIQGTSAQLPVAVQIIPLQVERKDENPWKKKPHNIPWIKDLFDKNLFLERNGTVLF